MHLLILCKRHLGSVERHVDSAFIGVECSAKGSCADGRFARKVGVGVFTVQGGVLNVGVAKRSDFVAGLERVRVGVVVVVGVGRVANSEAPPRGGRSGNGLVHTLDPPREQLAFAQVFFKPERGVRDFRILPRAELVDAALVGDGDDVACCTADRCPREDGLRRGRQQTVVLGVQDLAVTG